ncbi:Bug family tripartite tricarboxylate transporter substrate binding protein [Variovorax sp. PAMC26660]|uniref:Bug family tripartite tricarboxylate transporter substrate binding protein n=1 Tax=Variovorax sp. PAMC26660 TaxID=2762322 RepID=UPI00164E6BFB|nr:tripartite tricarboxylate transporter substrate binding protein [Variovorax sp. PAMC26660]QNK65947.1 tripartite tricarboxylate transporter substrate binding protein [Variovorax sp. PAMC26660]
MKTTSGFNRRQICVALAALGAAHASVRAQTGYPTRPITLVVGWPAGGPADNVARPIAAQMSVLLGQQLIVDNRPGAGGNIGSEFVARARPDGYTLMLATVASHGWNSALYPKLGYRPMEDFAPVGMISTSPGTLLVPVASAFHTMHDLVQFARANPGKLNYGSAGVGSSQHMAAAAFRKLTGVDMTHIPFKGTAPAMVELIAGRVDTIITTGATPFIRSGKLRALAVAARQRLPALPDVPTFEEAGVAGFYTDSWYGLVAPANTPRPALNTLNAALIKTIESREIQKQFADQGALAARPLSIDEYWLFVRKQMPEAAELVRNSGATME